MDNNKILVTPHILRFIADESRRDAAEFRLFAMMMLMPLMATCCR